ncbi:AimR family lysis-lysogeny pheromone receptor [Thalassobacillus pellis]|uniref:AimR family lysis-lysogeny pheromone receptor n=1 Tax=Thalassobacillus pellis TaxID=748008 RepID=UPI00195F662B|nr:AimR family lysis-lysogeny pheromone receptor [Thalassobacillus pellis]MBM7551994.1 hypothetical protein [Thalassobacillus pellis]
MPDYQIIEPSRLDRIQMEDPSSIYTIYHQLLRELPRKIAADRTRDYCMQHLRAKKEVPIALEFLYMNGYRADMRMLLEEASMKNSYKQLYGLLCDRMFNKRLSIKQLHKIERLRYQDPHLQGLRLFLLVYGYHDCCQFAIMNKYVEEIQDLLYWIRRPLVKYYFQLRLDEVLFQYYWKADMPVVAKKYAYRILHSALSYDRQCGVYRDLALCDVFNGYDAAMSHVMAGLELAEEHQLSRLYHVIKENVFPFIAAYHCKTENVTTRNVTESGHLAVAAGNYLEAERIFSTFETLTPFQECYLGVARNDSFALNRAHFRFRKEYCDQFFAKLPMHYKKYLR